MQYSVLSDYGLCRCCVFLLLNGDELFRIIAGSQYLVTDVLMGNRPKKKNVLMGMISWYCFWFYGPGIGLILWQGGEMLKLICQIIKISWIIENKYWSFKTSETKYYIDARIVKIQYVDNLY